MQSNSGAMIGGQPVNCQPCRCHPVNGAVADQLEGFQGSGCNAGGAIITSHTIRYIWKSWEGSCFDSEHSSLFFIEWSPSARIGGSRNFACRDERLRFWRVLSRDQHNTTYKALFQPSFQPPWQKIPTRPSFRYCAIEMCRMIEMLSKLHSMTRTTRPLFKRGFKNIWLLKRSSLEMKPLC